ncbi:MAG: pantothenate kinase [Clostridia bacterium]|nr:pantothenate kinase [Clostridia bacterium]
MGIVIGIDVGGSTTKIVGFKRTESGNIRIEPQFVRANDPLTATYGAFGKFTDENRIAIKDIDRVMMTGVGSSHVKRDLYGIDCLRVPEFNCIGRGGLFLAGLDRALVVSMGTGTAVVHATLGGEMQYLGGTGVGGGTLIGLSKLLVGAESIEHITEYAEGGDLANVDLRIKDISSPDSMTLAADMTAANFGNVSDVATKSDLALGAMNLVFETIGMVSVFAARCAGVRDIVLTGNLTRLGFCKGKYDELNSMGYGVKFVIPECAQFSTVIGAALLGLDK